MPGRRPRSSRSWRIPTTPSCGSAARSRSTPQPEPPSPWSFPATATRFRNQEAACSAKILGVDLHQPADLTVAWLSDLLITLRPLVVVTHPLRDTHPGHRDAAELAVDALPEALVTCGHPRRVYTCDTYNSLTLDGPVPTHTIVDISTTFDTKMRALAAHVSQPIGQRFGPMAETLARLWGARAWASHVPKPSFLSPSSAASCPAPTPFDMPDVPAGGEVTASGRDARRALGPAWDEAWQASHGATIFQSSGWSCPGSMRSATKSSRSCCALRVATHPGRCRPAVGRVDIDDLTVVVTMGRLPRRDRCHRSPRLHDARRRAAGLANEGARIELNEVRQDSALARVARQAGLRSSRGTPTHAIDLRNSATVRRILDRREHVTKMRRLHRIGDVKLVHHTQGPTINERLRRFITMHQTQWSGRPDAVAPFDGGAVDEFFRQLTARCSGAVISELTVEGEPIAMRYGFLWNRTYAGYRPTFDLAMQRFSPGLLHLRSMVDDFAHRGLHRLDLMRGDHKHKARFADVRNESLTFATGADVGQPEA